MLNKLVLRVLLSLSLAFSIVGTSNATLISQDILFNSIFDTADTYEVIGSVSVDLETADIIGDFALITEWDSFSFYGYEVDAFDPVWSYFYAYLDITNIYQGIESLDFDVTLFTDLSFAGYIDTYDQTNSVSYSLFDNADASLYDAGSLMFGEANVVPLPATIVLFLTGLIAVVVRRKYS